MSKLFGVEMAGKSFLYCEGERERWDFVFQRMLTEETIAQLREMEWAPVRYVASGCAVIAGPLSPDGTRRPLFTFQLTPDGAYRVAPWQNE